MKYGELPEIVASDGKKYHGFKFKVANPPKEAILRLPANEELMQRLGQITFIRRAVGKGTKTQYVDNVKADVVLFNALRLDGGDPFDEYEASNAVAKLLSTDTVDCQANGAGYAVTIKTRFGEHIHHVGIPTERAKTLYGRMSQSTIMLPRGQSEVRNHLAPAVELYDSIAGSVEGYVDGMKAVDVPPHHKSRVVVEVLDAIDVDGDLDPNS